MIVRPTVPDAVLRDPQTRRLLPADGGPVPRTSFWLRRLHDGDVALVDPAPAPKRDTREKEE